MKRVQLFDVAGNVIPIVSLSIESDVVDFVHSTRLSMTFKNPSLSELIDVTYVQPIDPEAALYEMRVCVGDRTIEASAKEKGHAKKVFEDAKRAGHGAYLGRRDDHMSDVYRLSLGNVLPGEEVMVIVSFVAEVNLEDNREDGSVLRFSIPLGLFQRYSPTHRSSQRPDAHSYDVNAVVPVVINVRLDMACGITAVTSPSAVPLDLRFDKGGRSGATITAHTSSSIGDFVLLIEREEAYESCLWVPSMASGGSDTTEGRDQDEQMQVGQAKSEATKLLAPVACMTTMFPNLPVVFDNDQLCEIIFIVDRSG